MNVVFFCIVFYLETPVGFEPTILELCRLLQLTTLPWCQRQVHYRELSQKASFSICKRMSSQGRYMRLGIYRERSRSVWDRRLFHIPWLSGWTWAWESMDCTWPRILIPVMYLCLRIWLGHRVAWYTRDSSCSTGHSRARHIGSMWWSRSDYLAWWWDCWRIHIWHQEIRVRAREYLIVVWVRVLQYWLSRVREFA